MFHFRWGFAIALYLAFCPSIGRCQSTIDGAAMLKDVQALDSILRNHDLLNGSDLRSLNSRDDLLSAVEVNAPLNRLAWAQLIHGWLRSANDAHTRVRFELLADSLTGSLPPSSDELLRINGVWEGFAPGPESARCARVAWMRHTWPWIGTLVLNDAISQRSDVLAVDDGGDYSLRAGMAVVDHGAFSRWIIRDFSSGSRSAFKRAFRQCVRVLDKAQLPILLDLRGNLGGFRTRRHAVLSFFLSQAEWPEERESKIGADDKFLGPLIPPLPALRVHRRTDVPLAVMVDGLSFSASLLLADALLFSDRAHVFGVLPLGQSGGCSGSPVDHSLPGSGLVVTVPTLRTTMGKGPLAPFDLPDDASPEAGEQAWARAVQWLLSADLDSPR